MKILWIKVLLGACALAAVLPMATAAEPQPGEVAGSGSVEIKRMPEFLRVQVEVLAKGKDVKDALAKLEGKEAVRAQLVSLGAGKDAIEFGTAAITTDKTGQQLETERMLGERLKNKKPVAKEPPPTVVVAVLKVDMPLKAASVEELLVSSHALIEKIKAADLSGVKEMEKLSPKEEEVAEEMEELRGRYGQGYQGPKRGEPNFLFVARITEEERSKALAEAYQKAKKDAGRLARAAGMELGALAKLNAADSASGGVNDEVISRYYDSPYPYQRPRFNTGSADDGSPGEAIGTEAGTVSLRILVSANFNLKSK